jgi:mRNA interferase MazF
VRGDLFRLRSEKDTAGHEQRGPRYAVAIQSDGILLSTLIVAPDLYQRAARHLPAGD